MGDTALPSAPWHAAHTALALASPAARSCADADCAANRQTTAAASARNNGNSIGRQLLRTKRKPGAEAPGRGLWKGVRGSVRQREHHHRAAALEVQLGVAAAAHGH